jgi:hypothetical protein
MYSDLGNLYTTVSGVSGLYETACSNHAPLLHETSVKC